MYFNNNNNNKMKKQNKPLKRVDVNKTLTILAKISDEANVLYKNCEEEGGEDLMDPTVWLLNQDIMRRKWVDYKILLQNVPEESKNELLNTNLAKYMKFMFDSYPDGFGKKLFECCDNVQKPNVGKRNIKHDAVEIYLSLI